MVILIGADGGKYGGPARFLDDTAEAAKIIAGNKRYDREADRRDRLDDEHIESEHQERDLRKKQDARADKDQARQDALAPTQQAIAEQTLRAGKMANDSEQGYQDAQHEEEKFDKRVAFDSWRQAQAQEYKRVFGEDIPEDFWQQDSEGHKPGEMGWHWSDYDPKSPIPVDVQINLRKALAGAATLPPASRAQRHAEAVQGAKDATLQQHRDAILAEAQSHAMPDETDGKQAGEPDPQAFIPKDTIATLEKMAKDPNSKPDEMQKRLDGVTKAHAQEVAGMEARTEALTRIDNFFGRISEMDMAYGDTGATKKHDPMDWELARTLRHQLEGSKMSGKALEHAEQRIYATLKGERPIKTDNDKTGLSPGKALELAMGEASDPMSPLSKKIKAAPEDQREQIIEMRARGILNSARSLAGGDMPGTPSPGNGSHPNTPDDQARAAAAVQKERGKPDPAQATALQAKAKAAGWTRDEFVEYGRTGKAPAGKPPIQ